MSAFQEPIAVPAYVEVAETDYLEAPLFIGEKILPQGPKGDPGPAGAPGLGANYLTFTQNQPQTTWLIPHNFGRRPAVQIVDMAGETVIVAVKHLDTNTVQIDFSLPFSGQAFLTA